MKKRICILSFSNIAFDSRVLREIAAALPFYEVDVIGFGNWTQPSGVHFFSVSKEKINILKRLIRRLLVFLGRFNTSLAIKSFWMYPEYRCALKILKNKKYSIIHANDWNALPVAAESIEENGSRILYDAHEYTPSQHLNWEENFFFIPIKISLLKYFAKKVTTFITVSEGLKKLYKDHFGWDCSVIKNAPYYQPIDFKATNNDSIRIVYHGGASQTRRLDELIYLIPKLDERFHLDFFLIESDHDYILKLQEIARQVDPSRIHFLPSVKPDELVKKTSSYDIGIHLLPPVSLNHIHALPNKFFDYMMSGLAVVILESNVDMADIVQKAQTGIVCSDTYSLARQLNQITTEQLDNYKHNSLELAKQINAEKEMEKLLLLYEKTISR